MKRALALALACLGACESLPVVGRPSEVERPFRVGVLVTEGVHSGELVAPCEVFERVRALGPRPLQVLTIAPTRMPIESAEGLRLVPDFGFRGAPDLDVLVVPSGTRLRERDLRNGDLVAWLRESGRDADWLVTLGEGAFLLAQAGLLDGLRVTVGPESQAALRERYPALEVLAGVSFVHDGKLISSTGGAASYEAVLYLCQRIWGEVVAQRVGGELSIDWELDYADWLGPGSESGRGSGPR